MGSSFLWLRLPLVLSLFNRVVSLALPAPEIPSPTTSGPKPQSTACGNLIRDLERDGNFVLAKSVYDCFITVPFNQAVGTRLVKYYQDTLQFQANLDYLSSPPESYQQPAVDLLAGLASIQQAIDQGDFWNQYQFESAVQNLLYSANDPHLLADFGLLSAFQFGSVYGLTAISEDGISPSQVYFVDDIFDYQDDAEPTWKPSPVTSINGTTVNDFITQFAALNSPGSIEPHADWNQVFENPVRDAFLDDFSLFSGGATFYPGDDLNFEFANGTILNSSWVAAYNFGDTGPLETGGDFYNFFVLGLPPASLVPPPPLGTTDSAADSSDDSFADGFNPDINELYFSSGGAFPLNVDIEQDHDYSSRYITGYLFNDTSESPAVLSIPTFNASAEYVISFGNAVDEFLSKAKLAGKTKIVIDLQQNDGGDQLLAYNTFRQFFPDMIPFGGSNMRTAAIIDATGSSISAWYSQLSPTNINYTSFAASDFVVTNRLNGISNKFFSSWADFYGPYSGNGTSSSATQRYDTTNLVFDESNFGSGDFPAALTKGPNGSPPFSASDIVILSDAACGSACALFVEMMHYEAGVKTVVVGGRPEPGPMQAVGGSRGAVSLDVTVLDKYIQLAQEHGGPNTQDLPNRADQSIAYYAGGLTLRNQVRANDPTPLQMLYDAADCRIQLTLYTFYNLTRLWSYAADATWSNASLCVPGSTGFAVTSVAPNDSEHAPARNTPSSLSYSSAGILQLPFPVGAEVPFDQRPAPDSPGTAVGNTHAGSNATSPDIVPVSGSSNNSEVCGKKRKRQSGDCNFRVAGSHQAARIQGRKDGLNDGRSNNYDKRVDQAAVSPYYKQAYANGFEQSYGLTTLHPPNSQGPPSRPTVLPYWPPAYLLSTLRPPIAV